MHDKAEIIESILSSLWYNRKTEHVIGVIKELISRVEGEYPVWTDDGNIIYGTLVILCGNYGVSPRAGWIDKDVKGEVLLSLREELEYYQRSLRLWSEDDERSNH